MSLARGGTLAVTGPEAAGVPSDRSNLVLKAAALAGRDDLAIRLQKNLPAASGIGGGSSDAAAVLRALAATPQREDLARLGADIAMCLSPSPQRVQGIGDTLSPQILPSLPAILVNPRVAVATPAVFKALVHKSNAPMPVQIPSFASTRDCIDWLARQRNDLQAPAISLTPAIGDVLRALQGLPGCRLARMSGSGATCFALFEDDTALRAGASRLRAAHSDWWIAAGALGDQRQKAQPESCA